MIYDQCLFWLQPFNAVTKVLGTRAIVQATDWSRSEFLATDWTTDDPSSSGSSTTTNGATTTAEIMLSYITGFQLIATGGISVSGAVSGFTNPIPRLLANTGPLIPVTKMPTVPSGTYLIRAEAYYGEVLTDALGYVWKSSQWQPVRSLSRFYVKVGVPIPIDPPVWLADGTYQWNGKYSLNGVIHYPGT